MNKLDVFNKSQLKQNIPDIRPGDTVRVHQKVKEQDEKERIQVLEGLIIAIKNGKGANATFTVRKIFQGVGVERIFSLHSPTIAKIEIIKHSKVRRAKLYYMRERRGKKARMSAIGGSAPTEAPTKSRVLDKVGIASHRTLGGKTKELIPITGETEEIPKEGVKTETPKEESR